MSLTTVAMAKTAELCIFKAAGDDGMIGHAAGIIITSVSSNRAELSCVFCAREMRDE